MEFERRNYWQTGEELDSTDVEFLLSFLSRKVSSFHSSPERRDYLERNKFELIRIFCLIHIKIHLHLLSS